MMLDYLGSTPARARKVSACEVCCNLAAQEPLGYPAPGIGITALHYPIPKLAACSSQHQSPYTSEIQGHPASARQKPVNHKPKQIPSAPENFHSCSTNFYEHHMSIVAFGLLPFRGSSALRPPLCTRHTRPYKGPSLGVIST